MRPDESHDLLAEARVIGEEHARGGLRTGRSLADMLAAITFFRATLLEVALLENPSATAAEPQTSTRLLRRIERLLGEVQTGLVEVYTARMNGPMRVAVIGGGIAGLATAYHLQEEARASGRTLECTLIERDSRLGGKIATSHQDGFVVEGGPDCFLTQKPWAVEMCRRLGLGDELIGTNEASRKVFILWKGKMHRLPDGVLLIIPTRFMPFALSPLISPLGKLRMGLDLVTPARK